MKSVFGQSESSRGLVATKRNRVMKMRRAMALNLALLMLLIPILSMVPAAAGAFELGETLNTSLESTATAAGPEDEVIEESGPVEDDEAGVDVGGLAEAISILPASDELPEVTAQDSLTPGIYLVPLALTTATGGSSSQSSNFDASAVVVVTSTGNTVNFFQTGGIISGPPVAGSSIGLVSYKYDLGQNATFATGAGAATFTNALREDTNVAGDAVVIAVDWPKLADELIVSALNYRGSGMPVGPNNPATVTFGLKLDIANATAMTNMVYRGFDFTPPVVADKTALQQLVDQVELLNLSTYTATSSMRLTNALTSANGVLADGTATQTQVDSARTTLQAALSGLVTTASWQALQSLVTRVDQLNPLDYTSVSFATLATPLANAKSVLAASMTTQAQVTNAHDLLKQAFDGLVKRPPAPPGTLEPGKVYLANVFVRRADNINEASSAAEYYDRKAVVEVRKDGGHTVHYFQTNTFDLASNYLFDSTQNDDNARAELGFVRSPERFNANRSALRITTDWPQLSRTLMVNVSVIRGSGAPVPTDMRLQLDRQSAVELTSGTYLGFNFTGGTPPIPPQKPANKAALLDLINQASQIDLTLYTQASVDTLNTALAHAREVYAHQSASQIVVDRAYGSLLAAIRGLEARPSDVIDKDNMTDGRYTVRVDFWHATQDTASFANNSLNHIAIIDVSNGARTMSLSTKPIQVVDTIVALRQLDVNGNAASVIANNITVPTYGTQPSAFSFPLPNTDPFQPVVFHLTPGMPGSSSPPGRLRISWDTLQASAGAGLSSDTSVVEAPMPDLDEIDRTAELTDEKAPEPTLRKDSDNDKVEAEAGGTIERIASKLPWYAWTAIGFGIVAACAAGWTLFKKRVAPKGNGLHEIDNE